MTRRIVTAMATGLLLLAALPADAAWEAEPATASAGTVRTATLQPADDADAALGADGTVTGSWTSPHAEADYTVTRTIGDGDPTTVTGIDPGGTFTDDVTQRGENLPLTAIAAGPDHTCALDATGSAWCWGAGGNGRLGTGNTTNQSRPTRVDTIATFTAITAGGFTYTGVSHTCALDTAGSAWCWGAGGNGRLGTGNTTDQSRPTRVDTTATFTAITAGVSHTCALDTAGSAWCWGAGGNGRLGTGNTTDQSRPTRVDSTTTFTAITAGDQHTCAIATTGSAWCWGAGDYGQLGTGVVYISRPSPISVDSSETFTAIAAGLYSTCAIATTGSIWCWGMGSFGQLGTGALPQRVTWPVRVDSSETFTAIAAGLYSTCAVAADGAAWCWGDNGSGQLGTGTPSHQSRPARVDPAVDSISITTGGDHTCALTTVGSAWCSGKGTSGQLGTGATIQRQWSPVTVRSPVRCPASWEKGAGERCHPGPGLPIRYTLDYTLHGWTPAVTTTFEATR